MFDPSINIIDSSKLKDYASCPRYFLYRHVMGWETETPSNHLVFGSAVHLALEHLLLNGYEVPSILQAYDKFLAEYRKTFTSETDALFEPKTPNNFLLMLPLYAKKWARDLVDYETLHTEIAGKILISQATSKDFYLHFRMDSVLRHRKSGKIKSLEHKTASSDWMWTDQWDLSFQAGTYSHVLNALYEFDKVEGVEFNGLMFKKSKKGWDELSKGRPLSVNEPYGFNRYLLKRSQKQMAIWHGMVLSWLQNLEYDLNELIDQNDRDEVLTSFPCNPDHCISYGRRCLYADFCNAWVNPWPRRDEVPPGFRKNFWNPMDKPANKIVDI